MNVNDVEVKEQSVGCKLSDIFEQQGILHRKYKPIEEKNGTGFGSVLNSGPYDINNRHWQMLLKEFSYRVTEELTESAEAYGFYLEKPENRDHLVHTIEELVDALHFLTEYCIVIGLTPQRLMPDNRFSGMDRLDAIYDSCLPPGQEISSQSVPSFYKAYYFDVVVNLGTASNLLKLRPWKNAYMITDEERYLSWVAKAYFSLIGIFRAFGVTPTEIHEMYVKKNTVNNWRIGSGY